MKLYDQIIYPIYKGNLTKIFHLGKIPHFPPPHRETALIETLHYKYTLLTQVKHVLTRKYIELKTMASLSEANSFHWLDRYGSQEYRWKSLKQNSRTSFYREVGFVEFSFDVDGRYYEGRADMNAQLELEIRTSLGHHDFRERILFAWACLRCQHLLLQAKALTGHDLFGKSTPKRTDVYFKVDVPRSVSEAIEDAAQNLVFTSDHFDYVSPWDFWIHCQNSARILDPSKALSKVFVHGLEPTKDGCSMLRLLFIVSHSIWDGMTTYTCFRDFVFFLNQPIQESKAKLVDIIQEAKVLSRLPPPQEQLYPAISGNRARQRWFWLLTRILRHVRRPLPAGFENPLKRQQPRAQAVPLSPTYAPLLDYSKPPILNSIPCYAKASPNGTKRLHRLCREANVSIGAGVYALAAIIMMEFHERRETNIPLSERRPFITGFPLNPRVFFNYHVEPNSLMLAFNDGIRLPFLPSDLDLDGRIRVLARQAHRQLSVYQKRANPKRDDDGLRYMGSRGAGRMLQTQYVGSIERLDANLPEHLKRHVSPQGAYPMRPNATMQTCGVSSVGSRKPLIEHGAFDLNDKSKDLVADHRLIHQTVRPRNDEFLVGVGGSDNGLFLNASVDGNSMDPMLVEQWRTRFETILDEEQGVQSRL